ncbi:tRNA ligase 1 [Tanacetum coccineum]
MTHKQKKTSRSEASAETITSGIEKLAVDAKNVQSHVPVTQLGSIAMDEISPLHEKSNGRSKFSPGSSPVINGNVKHSKKDVFRPKSNGTVSDATVDAAKSTVNTETETGALSNLSENFTVDDSTYVTANIRATFYPKFENEKSDQEVRNRMIELVSKGLAVLEVSLKHSGSLFMYAGHEGGAYAKNSYGNVYTAVGVFVLGRVFREAWGTEASKKQAEFNEFLERGHMSISMELVTADLGDHGQRPREDYVVVTAVTKLGNGKPRFYSTPDIIAFCTKWRLPTNHIWLFSTRNSVTSFFAAYDALCEEGTATSVCKVLDEVADISVPGSIDHIKMQGEILEGLVARIVRHESIKEMQLVLQNYSSPVVQVHQDLGPGLREISAAYRSDDKQTKLNRIKALLQNTGTSFCPDYVDWFDVENADVLPRAANNAVVDKFLQASPTDYLTTKFMAIKERAEEIAKTSTEVGCNDRSSDIASRKNGLADTDANLMIKLKFLTYKLRTFLIRKGLSELFKKEDGLAAYKTYYIRQMESWNLSPGKQKQLSKMLDEWAVYIRRKCGDEKPSSSTYLNEAEPFLEQYAKRSPENQVLLGYAGDLVRSRDFLAGRDEARDLQTEKLLEPSSPSHDSFQKKGLIVFFPGIPGCAKSALCKEILGASGGFEDDRPIHILVGDLIEGKYWQKVADELRKDTNSIVLADKNAPNEDVWRQIEDMLNSTKASAVPIVPDCEGTKSNPFSLDALAVFIYRVLNRVNHPKNLDKSSQKVGYVLLKFYRLYEGKNRSEFESKLIDHFGSLVKMPLLKSGRSLLPDSVKRVLEEGINLYRLHTKRHGRKTPSTEGMYVREWVAWEEQLREVLSKNAKYLTSFQVPFELAVNQVLEQLKRIMKGDYVNCIGNPPQYGEKISSKKEWPHLTLWTAQGIPPKEANALPKLVLQGKATRVKIDPPFRITGVLHFH